MKISECISLFCLFLFQIITVRNHTMHSPDLTLDDEYMMDSLKKMVEFLESVQSGANGKYDVTDCQTAVSDIRKVVIVSHLVAHLAL